LEHVLEEQKIAQGVFQPGTEADASENDSIAWRHRAIGSQTSERGARRVHNFLQSGHFYLPESCGHVNVAGAYLTCQILSK
jgi:hypothetical protein